MKNKFILFLLLSVNVFAFDFGIILNNQNSKEESLLANDINLLLSEYNISIKNSLTKSSYDSINRLLEKKDNSYFAIVKKDAISYFNKNNNIYTNIYSKIPAILTLGGEQIHIFANENNDFDFDIKKEFNVYCEGKNSDSCIALEFIKNAYNFKFNYIKSNKDTIFNDLKSNKVDIFISVKKAPYEEYKNLVGVRLLDLPTNFNMEDMYIHSIINQKDYPYIDEKIHSYSSVRVLVTNLNQYKYKDIINSLLKIIILNQDYFQSNGKLYWKDIDFNYFEFKKFSLEAKRTILDLKEKIKAKNALIF